jgi:hypothetical protein
MVGHGPLKAGILVRIQVPQQILDGLVSRFFENRYIITK